MKALFISFFLFFHTQDTAAVQIIPMTMESCIELRDTIREKQNDPDFWAKNKAVYYQGQAAIYMGSECVPVFESDEL